MGRRVTLELPDEVLSRAERLAMLTQRKVTDVLADAVLAVLLPWDVVAGPGRPVAELSDDEVWQLAELRLDPVPDRRLSHLLERHQEGQLTDPERTELLSLMQQYGACLLRQAEALAEAVRRGLRDPLAS